MITLDKETPKPQQGELFPTSRIVIVGGRWVQFMFDQFGFLDRATVGSVAEAEGINLPYSFHPASLPVTPIEVDNPIHDFFSVTKQRRPTK